METDPAVAFTFEQFQARFPAFAPVRLSERGLARAQRWKGRRVLVAFGVVVQAPTFDHWMADTIRIRLRGCYGVVARPAGDWEPDPNPPTGPEVLIERKPKRPRATKPDHTPIRHGNPVRKTNDPHACRFYEHRPSCLSPHNENRTF